MRSLLCVCAASLLAAAAPAQEIFYAEHRGHMCPVQSVRGTRPFVDDHGKLVSASGTKYALKNVAEFLPVFIAVTKVAVKSTGLEVVGGANTINNQLEFGAEFTSPYQLEDVFLVLELVLADGTTSIVFHEIGRIEPSQPRWLDLAVPLAAPLGEGRYKLHLYTAGQEILHSKQPLADRESALDRMIKKRLAGVTDAAPKFFVGPVPAYPEKLAKTRIPGRATLRARIRPTGAVVDPVVVDASDAAFGASALGAVRQWRFLPLVKAGRPTETMVTIPITFTPPDSTEKS